MRPSAPANVGLRSPCVSCVTLALLVRSCTFLVSLLCAGHAFLAIFVRLASVSAHEFTNALIICAFLVCFSCVGPAFAIFIVRLEILIYFRFSNAHGTHIYIFMRSLCADPKTHSLTAEECDASISNYRAFQIAVI